MVLTIYGWAVEHYTPPEKDWKESPVLKGVYRKGKDFLVMSPDPIDANNPVLSFTREVRLSEPYFILTDSIDVSDCVKWIKSFGVSVRVETLGPEGLNAGSREKEFDKARKLLDEILAEI